MEGVKSWQARVLSMWQLHPGAVTVAPEKGCKFREHVSHFVALSDIGVTHDTFYSQADEP